jgi:UDP-3-O-acyl-N-acetylglucosamine deacetylase
MSNNDYRKMRHNDMSVTVEGNCLSGGYSKVEVSSSDRFKLLHHVDSRPPTSIPLTIDNIKVEHHLLPYTPFSSLDIESRDEMQRGEDFDVSSVERLRKGTFVSVGREPSIHVVEHLLSALYGLNLFNVQIDVFGSELPFFDGSSREYTEKLKGMFTKEKPHGFSVDKKVVVSHESSYIMYEPLKKDILMIDMELFHPFIDKQQISLEINEKSFIEEIAPARTFVFTDESDPRLKDLPPYGIGVTRDNIYSSEPLRYKDELVRHKILDLLGDLYILQKRLAGKISSRNTFHLLNLEFTRKLMGRLLHKYCNRSIHILQ